MFHKYKDYSLKIQHLWNKYGLYVEIIDLLLEISYFCIELIILQSNPTMITTSKPMGKRKIPRIKRGSKPLEPDTPKGVSGMNSRFKRLRLQHQMSQEEWGEVFNLQRTSISAIELENQSVTPYVMEVLHRKYGVDLNWFVCGDAPAGTSSAEIQQLKRELEMESKLRRLSEQSLEECRLNLSAIRKATGLE